MLKVSATNAGLSTPVISIVTSVFAKNCPGFFSLIYIHFILIFTSEFTGTGLKNLTLYRP